MIIEHIRFAMPALAGPTISSHYAAAAGLWGITAPVRVLHPPRTDRRRIRNSLGIQDRPERNAHKAVKPWTKKMPVKPSVKDLTDDESFVI